MSKSALGRGLGTLLGSTKIPGQDGSGAGDNSVGSGAQPVGRGMGTLLKGEGVECSASREMELPAVHSAEATSAIPSWYFFGADLLLLGLAFSLIGSGPVGPVRLGLAGVAVGLGAVLGVMGVLRRNVVPTPTSASRADQWVLVRQGGPMEEERFLIVHTIDPVFVGEVQRAFGGRVQVTPLPVQGGRALTASEEQEMVGAAVEAYRDLSEQLARELRAALS